MLPRNRKIVAALLRRKLALILKSRVKKREYMSIVTIKRPHLGADAVLMKDLVQSQKEFQNYFHMETEVFRDLLERVKPAILHHGTHRYPIGQQERLSLTLKKLFTGESFKSLHFHYRCGVSTAQNIFYEGCRAIYNVLKDEFLSAPSTEKWQKVSQEYWERWQFPCCLGSIDGKHVTIKAPPNTGSDFYNYKGQFSVNFMSVTGPDEELLYVNVGSKGRNHDSTVFFNTELGQAVTGEIANLPLPRCLPNTTDVVPHTFVADNAFHLCRNIMTPFSGKNLTEEQADYNARLSRARHCVETGFGILAARFRILRSPIKALPENVDYILLACACLHNYLLAKGVREKKFPKRKN